MARTAMAGAMRTLTVLTVIVWLTPVVHVSTLSNSRNNWQADLTYLQSDAERSSLSEKYLPEKGSYRMQDRWRDLRNFLDKKSRIQNGDNDKYSELLEDLLTREKALDNKNVPPLAYLRRIRAGETDIDASSLKDLLESQKLPKVPAAPSVKSKAGKHNGQKDDDTSFLREVFAENGPNAASLTRLDVVLRLYLEYMDELQRDDADLEEYLVSELSSRRHDRNMLQTFGIRDDFPEIDFLNIPYTRTWSESSREEIRFPSFDPGFRDETENLKNSELSLEVPHSRPKNHKSASRPKLSKSVADLLEQLSKSSDKLDKRNHLPSLDNTRKASLGNTLPAFRTDEKTTASQSRFLPFIDDERPYQRRHGDSLAPPSRGSFEGSAIGDRVFGEAPGGKTMGEQVMDQLAVDGDQTEPIEVQVRRGQPSRHAHFIQKLYRPSNLEDLVNPVELANREKTLWLLEKHQKAVPLRRTDPSQVCGGVPQSRGGVSVPMNTCASDRTICLQDAQYCDGVLDCPDGEDENRAVCVMRLWAFSWLRTFQSFFQTAKKHSAIGPMDRARNSYQLSSTGSLGSRDPYGRKR